VVTIFCDALSLTLPVYLHAFSRSVVASKIPKSRKILRKFELAVQGHPASSILVPIEKVCATSYYYYYGRFRYWRIKLENGLFPHPTLFDAPLRRNPLEFLDETYPVKL